MNRQYLCCVIVLMSVYSDSRVRADAPGDLAPKVRSILETRCASCHGPDVPRPKGKFGYVLDLRMNPGGLLEQAIAVSDTFLPSGEIAINAISLSCPLSEARF